MARDTKHDCVRLYDPGLSGTGHSAYFSVNSGVRSRQDPITLAGAAFERRAVEDRGAASRVSNEAVASERSDYFADRLAPHPECRRKTPVAQGKLNPVQPIVGAQQPARTTLMHVMTDVARRQPADPRVESAGISAEGLAQLG